MKKLPEKELLALAISICRTLFEHGFVAYFAGGFVRERLLGHEAHEIDIATSASPTQVEALFSKTVPIGKPFGVILVIEQGISFEVTTFRKDHPYQDGRHPAGVDFSTAEKDALRRDFTINGMFYDPLTDKVFDYVGGKEDLERHIIKAIGDPFIRFQEDRLRMIRAVRFATRLSFTIEEKTKEAIKKEAPTLFPSVSMERIWQELQKMASYPHFDRALLLLQELELLPTIFPSLQGKNLKPLVASFPYFPLEAPTITYLIQLFPETSLQDKLALCHYLKLSNEESKLVTFFDQAKELFAKKEADRFAWASFYAHPKAALYLDVHKALLPYHAHLPFAQEHAKKQKELEVHIMRLKNREPLITSQDLLQRGIKPGKRMGELLALAEKVSINENLHNKESLLSRLL